MPLSIGELVGYLRIDGSGVDQGVAAAEARVRRGVDTMGGAADGLDGRLGAAGRRAGESLGDGLADGAGEGADRAGDEVERASGGWKTVAMAGGAAAGAGMAGGFALAAAGAMELDEMRGTLTAQLGLTAEESERYGALAGDLYAGAYGENVTEVGDALRIVTQQVAGMAEASDEELRTVTAGVMNLAKTMEIDLGVAAGAVGQMIRNGMAKDATEALDLLNAGAQNGADRMGDLAEVFNEYGETFQTAGMSGATAMGTISQAMEAGAWSADLVADSIREFGIIAQAGGEDTEEAFAAIGLNGKQMAEDVAAGGDRSVAALDKTLDALRRMPPGAERSALAVSLFGTKAEEMGDALFAMDPSEAARKLGDFAGAAQRADAAMGETATAKVTALQRSVEMWSASLVATEGPMGTLAAGVVAFGPQALGMAGSLGMIAMAFGPMLLAMGQAAIRMTVWVATTIAQGAVAVASMAVTAAGYVASWILMAASGAVQVGILIGQMIAWAAGIVAQGAVALASLAVTAAGYVAQWVVMAVGAMARAAVMAAAWLVAMGPVGWVIAAVVGLVALIVANWDTVVAWTTSAWNTVTSVISSVWNTITGAVSGAAAAVWGAVSGAWNTITGATSAAWNAVTGAISGAWDTVTGLVSNAAGAVMNFISNAWNSAVTFTQTAWNNIVNAVTSGAQNVLSFVGSLPGRIVSALGDLGNLLVNAGRNIVQGLWNGIAGMGNWLYNQIMGWIRSVVPGPVLQFLGIASPSKWMKNEVGRWIPEGLADGIIGNARVAAQAARDMAAETAAGAQAGSEAAMSRSFSMELPGIGSISGSVQGGDGATADRSVHVTINNPIVEKASDSINRASRSVAYLGMGG